jgi:polysaccharide export outer membrane protein
MLLAGCTGVRSTLPRGESAYTIFTPASAENVQRDYRLGPLDTVSVVVFQEPELSFQNMQIDASGNLLYPLVGSVRAQGKTAAELSAELADRLNRFLVDPQVTVSVASSVSQRVTVEGAVTQPGVYDVKGSSSLLEALALARSPTRVAKLDEIVVFRNINGERHGARFDIKRIRAGLDPDPEILGGDVVVVGFSFVQEAWRDFLTAAPILNVFTRVGV